MTHELPLARMAGSHPLNAVVGSGVHLLKSTSSSGNQHTANPLLAAVSQMTNRWRLSGSARIHRSRSTTSRTTPVIKKAMPPLTNWITGSGVAVTAVRKVTTTAAAITATTAVIFVLIVF